jgi:hypothetical protein
MNQNKLKPLKRFGTLFLLKNLLSLLSKRKLPTKAILSNLQFAIVITGFGTTFSALKKNPVVAGCIASLWILVDWDRKRTATIAQILVIRSLFFALRAWIYDDSKLRLSRSKIVEKIRSLLDRWGSQFVWVTTAFHICYTNFVNPDYFTRSYFGFLIYMLDGVNRFGPNADQILKSFSRLNHILVRFPTPHRMEFIPPDISSKDHILSISRELTGTEMGACLDTVKEIVHVMPVGIHHDRFGCAMLHPQYTSCAIASVSTIKDVFRITYKTHLMLNLFSFVNSIVTKYQKQKRISLVQVRQLVVKVLKNSIRSCLMMAVYFGVYTLSVCYLGTFFKRQKLVTFGIAVRVFCFP